ncbi:MAG: hypothetical protein FWF59_10280 [Turicibacter sp.]|nr:hypothetical protein [Turicibacter sp.]
MKKKNLIVGGAAVTTTLAGLGILAFKKLKKNGGDEAKMVKGGAFKLSSDGGGINQDFVVKVGKKRFFNIASQISEGEIEIIVSNPDGEVLEIIDECNGLTSLDLKEYEMGTVLVSVHGSFMGEVDMKMSR